MMKILYQDTLYVGRVPQWSAPHSGQTLVEYWEACPANNMEI